MASQFGRINLNLAYKPSLIFFRRYSYFPRHNCIRKPISNIPLHSKPSQILQERRQETHSSFAAEPKFYSRSWHCARNMASDSDYMAFLNKVNQDPAAAHVSTAATMTSTEFKTMDDDMDVPKPIQKVTTDRFYTSDADEPFVPVCLKWEDNGNELPDESEFSRLFFYRFIFTSFFSLALFPSPIHESPLYGYLLHYVLCLV